MADPLSFVANITAVLSITAQSCQFLMTLFSNIVDAPAEVAHYSRWLHALHSTLTELQKLTSDPSTRGQISFDADFMQHLKDCMKDLQDVESRVRATGHQLKGNLVRRSWAKVKYGLMSEYSLQRLSWRLQVYQSTFSMALASIQLKLIAQNSVKLDQTLICLKNQPTNPKSTVVIKERTIPSQSFRACIDTVRAESSLQLESWLGGLLVWFGPTFGQEQSQRNSDGYTKHRTGHGIGLHIRLRSIRDNRSWAVDISLMNWTALSGRMSIQWNISIHSIVSENSDIFYYAKTSNLQAVKSILAARKGSPSDTTPNGLSLLHIASETNHLDLVNLLLEAGADPNARDCDGRTPLHTALTGTTNFEIIRTLVTHGADLGNRDVEGKTPCHTFFNVTVGKALLLYKEEIDSLQACDANGMSIAHYVAWSSKSSYRHVLASIPSGDMHPFVARDYLGRRTIHLAAQRGNIGVLRHLIDTHPSIDINCKDKDGQTALHYAVESKRVDAIKLLASKGAELHALDSRGRTPLHRAAAKNNVLAINCVLELAGNESIRKVDYQSRTPEQLARVYGATAAAEHLNAKSGNTTPETVQHASPKDNPLRATTIQSLKSTLNFNLSLKAHITILWILILFFIYRV